MKKIVASFAILLISGITLLTAQDLMVLKSGVTMKVKIVSSQPQEVSYKQPEVYGDSVLTKEKKEILVLIFENGYTELVNGTSSSRRAIIPDYPANRIAFDAFGFAGRELAFHYERILPTSGLALRVPVGFIYKQNNNYNNTFNYILNLRYKFIEDESWDYDPYSSSFVDFNRSMGIRTGLSLLVYFGEPRKVRGYIAPGLVLGYFAGQYDVTRVNYDPISGMETDRKTNSYKNSEGFIGTDFMIGMSVLTSSNISIGLETGGGYGTFIKDDNYDKASGIWRFSVLVGYNWKKK